MARYRSCPAVLSTTTQREPPREPTSVPDLSLDGLVVNIDATGSKLDTNRRLGFEVELISSESREY